MAARRGTTLVDEQTNEVVVPMVYMADTFWGRLRGLIGRKPLATCEAMLISPCNSVHTFWMSYPLRLTYFNAQGKVIGLVESISPRCFSRQSGAAYVLEQNANLPSPRLIINRTYRIERQTER